MSLHTKAILQALLVTFIWSLSWVLIKIGLEDIPSLVFAGLRYSIASICLLTLMMRSAGVRQSLQSISAPQLGWLALLGLVYYTLTQGSQFLALEYLPAVTLSLLLNFTTVVVALMGIVFIAEFPTFKQWLGIGVFLVGVLVYFYPIDFLPREAFGITVGVVSMLASASGGVLGRYVNRSFALSPLVVTTISMSIGSILLLVVGVTVQGLPALTLQSWLIILWLAVVHTAFAFTLWNKVLQTLSAVESSIINNTMLAQIALLAWIFLGESITLKGMMGLVLAMIGVLVVQLRRIRKQQTA